MRKNLAIMVQKMHETGVARAAANLSVHLPDNNYKKSIISYDTSRISYPFDGNIIDLNTKPKTGIAGKLMNFIKRIYRTWKLKRSKKIDVSISFQHSANLINIMTRKNDKVIISVRSFISKDLQGLTGFLYKAIITYFYNRADKVVAVSESIKTELIEDYGVHEDRVKVIYNFYDTENIRQLASEPIEIDKKSLFSHTVIITSGRLEKQKGQWHLVRAFKQVKEAIPDAKLVILGQGGLENYLKVLASDLGVDKDVHFLGFQSHLFKYIAHAAIYVFPSLYEGFPNALCEAMACGKPVISSDCKSGPREILEPRLAINQPPVENVRYAEYGVLVPVCDGQMAEANKDLSPEETLLADAMINLLQDRGALETYQKRSKDRINDFQVHKIFHKWEQIIN